MIIKYDEVIKNTTRTRKVDLQNIYNLFIYGKMYNCMIESFISYLPFIKEIEISNRIYGEETQIKIFFENNNELKINSDYISDKILDKYFFNYYE